MHANSPTSCCCYLRALDGRWTSATRTQNPFSAAEDARTEVSSSGHLVPYLLMKGEIKPGDYQKLLRFAERDKARFLATSPAAIKMQAVSYCQAYLSAPEAEKNLDPALQRYQAGIGNRSP